MGIVKSRIAAIAAGSVIVVGLGAGGAVAADMVGSPQIRNGAVLAPDIHRNAVRASEIDSRAIHRNHIADDAIGWRNLRNAIVDRINDSASDGESAYQIAVANGFEGTQAEWLDSLEGSDGDRGPIGPQGPKGEPGEDGNAIVPNFTVNDNGDLIAQWGDQDPVNVGRVTGVAGLSAYEVATRHGFDGTEAEWLASLKGQQGERGPLGLSAYEVAKREGFTGTREEWLASLEGEQGEQGPRGEPGVDGVSGYTLATNTLDFGPGGKGSAFCPEAGQVVLGGGYQLTDADVQAGFEAVSEWPYLADAENPDDRSGWWIQLNAPQGEDPGEVTVYAMCANVS